MMKLRRSVLLVTHRFYYQKDGKKLPKEMEAMMTGDDGATSYKDLMKRSLSHLEIKPKPQDTPSNELQKDAPSDKPPSDQR